MADSFIGGVLVWLKALANWVLRLFDLAGSSGANPLLYISRHWAVYLAVLLAVGTVTDLVVWMIRWRPYWIWTHQKRIIINDDRFFERGRRRGGGRQRGGDSLFEVPKQPTEKERRERIYAERLYDREEKKPVKKAAAKPARGPRARKGGGDPLFRTDDM